MAADAMKTAAVVPAWNEAGSLGALLEELRALPAGLLAQVIVVDGGSADGTPDVARAAGAQVIHQRRRGYGAACWEGYQAARAGGASHVVFLDGDGSDPPSAVPCLLAPLQAGDANLALGVRRRRRGAAHPLPWHARAGNALVCLLLRLRTQRRVSDLPSLKAISVADLDRLAMQQMGYGWTTELIAKALRRGYRVAELPVLARPRTAGVSKVSGNWRATARAGAALLRTALLATR
jgi:glycosyltransferase involved in cell wall biosynthesis